MPLGLILLRQNYYFIACREISEFFHYYTKQISLFFINTLRWCQGELSLFSELHLCEGSPSRHISEASAACSTLTRRSFNSQCGNLDFYAKPYVLQNVACSAARWALKSGAIHKEDFLPVFWGHGTRIGFITCVNASDSIHLISNIIKGI